jgi:hypothetical protein
MTRSNGEIEAAGLLAELKKGRTVNRERFKELFEEDNGRSRTGLDHLSDHAVQQRFRRALNYIQGLDIPVRTANGGWFLDKGSMDSESPLVEISLTENTLRIEIHERITEWDSSGELSLDPIVLYKSKMLDEMKITYAGSQYQGIFYRMEQSDRTKIFLRTNEGDLAFYLDAIENFVHLATRSKDFQGGDEHPLTIESRPLESEVSLAKGRPSAQSRLRLAQQIKDFLVTRLADGAQISISEIANFNSLAPQFITNLLPTVEELDSRIRLDDGTVSFTEYDELVEFELLDGSEALQARLEAYAFESIGDGAIALVSGQKEFVTYKNKLESFLNRANNLSTPKRLSAEANELFSQFIEVGKGEVRLKEGVCLSLTGLHWNHNSRRWSLLGSIFGEPCSPDQYFLDSMPFP